MRLVTNTSPLIFLAKIDALSLLQECFSDVLAPPSVLEESRLNLPGFVQRRELSDLADAYVRGALGALHRGELEAMVLARETGADLIALDDRMARNRARELGLTPIGTVGLLLFAQRRALVDPETAMTKIDALVQVHGLYLSPKILEQVRADLARSR